MTSLTISPYINVFKHQECLIVGKGPTLFDYSELKNINSVKLFINESALLCKEYLLEDKDNNFMFAHDIATKNVVENNKFYTCILPSWESKKESKYYPDFIDKNGIKIKDYCVLYNRNKGLMKDSPELCGYPYKYETCNIKFTDISRYIMAERNWLPTHIGTIKTALLFCFFTGISHIKFIGCDGLNKEITKEKFGHQYDKRLHKHISSKPWGSFYKYKNESEIILKNLNISYEYIGTPI